jgi:hypothetical protein
MKTGCEKRGRRACGLALAAALLAPVAGAELTTEMTFATPATNGTGMRPVKMVIYPPMAGGDLFLKGDGSHVTRINDLPTGISRRWDAKLHRGYLEIEGYANTADRDRIGAFTTNSCAHYLGVARASDIPGTCCLIFRPMTVWTTTTGRQALFGTGATTWATIKLHKAKNSTDLLFEFVRAQAPAAKCRIAASMTWDTNKWYFVSASWQCEKAPLLYIREMSPRGPAESPPAVHGTIYNADGFQDTVPHGVNNMPFLRPLVIGAYYFDDGGQAGIIDGAGAHIAYFRLDNNLSTYEQIEEIFNGLFAPADLTLMVVR